MLLENKVAVITGGGRGIGRAIAMHFAQEGADVALIARTSDQINQVAEDILLFGRNSFAVSADNIASGAGLRGLPGSAAYGASKAALIALSFALADEIRAQGLRVNVICPGLIKTDMVDDTTILAKSSNILLPDDVAGTAVFLASELSGQITGQVFSVRNSNRW